MPNPATPNLAPNLAMLAAELCVPPGNQSRKESD
jgi:hypothetical protein